MPKEDREWYREWWRKKQEEEDSGYAPEQERCRECGKILPNEDALLRHVLSEHRQKKTRNDANKKTTGILQKLYRLFFRSVQ